MRRIIEVVLPVARAAPTPAFTANSFSSAVRRRGGIVLLRRQVSLCGLLSSVRMMRKMNLLNNLLISAEQMQHPKPSMISIPVPQSFCCAEERPRSTVRDLLGFACVVPSLTETHRANVEPYC
jgi:hypothetical protein